MGIVLGRFRKKQTTIEVLEELDKNIKDLQKRRVDTEQWHRVVLGRLLLYSVGAYVIAALVFYFFFFPASLSEQIFYITPLLIFPLIVVFVKRGIAWYFKRQITHSESRLVQMEKQKQDILEEVMDKETYKAAKQILERFAPMKELAVVPPLPVKTSSVNSQRLCSISAPTSGADLRRRPLGQQSPLQQFQAPKLPLGAPARPQLAPMPLPVPGAGRYPGTYTTFGRLPPGPPVPRPIAPRERTVVDRLVDFLIADGPSNRYALICSQCASHNGLALKEEFDFVAFRCCYCFTMNPARKVRLSPPRIEDVGHSPTAPAVTGSGQSLLAPSDSESSGGPTDSESERVSGPDTPSEDEEGEKMSPKQPALTPLPPPPLSPPTPERELKSKEEKKEMKIEQQEPKPSPLVPTENGEKVHSVNEGHHIEELTVA